MVPKVNKTGCLALFWKKSVHIDVISSSPNHIDAIVGSNPQKSSGVLQVFMAL